MNLDDLMIMKHLTRWQNVPTVTRETVAEHSYFVAMIVLNLAAHYSFDVNKALRMALWHDAPEIWLTDCPHNVKRRFPALAREFKQAELELLDVQFSAEVRALLKEYITGESVEALVVKMADCTSVSAFCDQELAITNNKRISHIRQETEECLAQLAIKLKQYELFT